MVELFLQILVIHRGSYCHEGLSLWRNSSSFEAQGEVDLPRATPERVNSQSFYLLYWLRPAANALWNKVSPVPLLPDFFWSSVGDPHRCCDGDYWQGEDGGGESHLHVFCLVFLKVNGIDINFALSVENWPLNIKTSFIIIKRW